MSDLENLKLKIKQVEELMQRILEDSIEILYTAGARHVELNLEKRVSQPIGMIPITIHTIKVEVKL